MQIGRRSFVAGAALLSTPHLARAATNTLRFIPEADLAVLDPVWTTANVTRDHANLIFDTLYGYDAQYSIQPQMVEAHRIEDDGRRWTIRLRENLLFHNGDKVTAADVVATLRRWAARDSLGQTLMAATAALQAPSDRDIEFRLTRPFHVSRALTNGPHIMPAFLAKADAGTQVTEMIGSGPFRFIAAERVSGARAVYARFAGYVPRPQGTPYYTSGPKIAHVDRVEWMVVPDAGTAAAAMQSGEADWWGNPAYDLLPMLKRSPRLALEVLDPSGGIGILRFNHLHPPFDNPAIRRAVLGAVSQEDVMTTVAGVDRTYWRSGVGVFAPESPMASDVGLSVLTAPRDLKKASADLVAAGYRGERVVVLNPGDLPDVSAMAVVVADMLSRIGMTVDLQTQDWGTVIQRRAKDGPVEQGGWSVFTTSLNGSGVMDPATHIGLRANGKSAWAGWPTSPALEALRDAWLRTADPAEQQAICRQIQARFWIDVPYVPLGERFKPYAFNRRVSDIPHGSPLFYGVRLS